jgi:hypothetical protein
MGDPSSTEMRQGDEGSVIDGAAQCCPTLVVDLHWHRRAQQYWLEFQLNSSVAQSSG